MTTQTAALADHLDDQTDMILAVWRTTVERRGDVPNAERLSRSEFNDHVPSIIDRIAERLRGQLGDPSYEATEHGRLRWEQGYDIAEVVTELGHLRSTLLKATFAQAGEGLLGVSALEHACAAINDVIDEVTSDSVAEFQESCSLKDRASQADLERRQEQADNERNKLKTVIERLPVGVWVANADGLIVAINREAERLQGIGSREVVGRVNVNEENDIYLLRDADGRRLDPQEFPLARALRGEVVRGLELFWDRADRRITISADAAPLYDREGKISGAVGAAQDLTEARRLQLDLARRDEQFRLIVENSPALIWRSDSEGRCDYFNTTWIDFRGRSLGQERDLGWTDGIHPEDLSVMLRRRRDSFHRRESFEQTYRLLRRDGLYRWIVDRAAPWMEGDGTFLGYFGTCLDITDRVELETTLERQSSHKSRLLATLSHDARTPLNAVALAAELLESLVGDNERIEIQENLRTIRHSVRNVVDLLKDLLDLTRIDAGASPAATTRFAIDEALHECVSSIEHQAKAKGLELRCALDGLDHLTVETDRAKLKQIVGNLLSNAVRYTPEGSVRLVCKRTADRLLIQVRDTGVGIASEDRPRIFDEFAMLHYPARPQGEGTGLGLAICRRLANLLKGEILLESEVGQGSTFTLTLPLSIIVDGADAIPPQSVEAIPRTGSILIAEDHDISRKTLARVLTRMGFRTLEAGTGREVLDLLEQERPMLVLMDVNMPVMDGIAATRAIRSDPRFRDLPIFALTGDVTIVNQQKIGQAGVDGYLEKPVSYDQIEKAIIRIRERL